MISPPTRREFLATLGGLLPAAALAHASPSVLRAGPATEGGATPTDLPPRVVGLRSLGGSFRFDPPGLLIQPGEVVRWLNMGDFHTATSFHPDNSELLPAGVPRRVPQGAAAWHSGMLGLTGGTDFRHRFRVEGVHDYFCQPHYGFGMVGRIIVAGPRGGPAVEKGLGELPEEARIRMPAVESITGPSGRIFEWTARANGVLWARTHGGNPGAAAEAVVRGMAEDGELHAILERAGQSAPVGERLASFREGALGGISYDTLLHRADAVKELLREALPPARDPSGTSGSPR